MKRSVHGNRDFQPMGLPWARELNRKAAMDFFRQIPCNLRIRFIVSGDEANMNQ